MLLTALGYDAEIEGLQNVGAAWKANVLSLAREVGLMDRYYGDTNKPMTRDDMALLIWNFLNAEIVKGYYQNDVANVDTIMYVGGTALEVYFEKQVVYGAIVANEMASIIHADVDEDQEPVDTVLKDGYTTLFLYDNEEDVTLADIVKLNPVVTEQADRRTSVQDVIDSYFMTIKLSTALADIAEPVFVITDLEPTKGTYVATGDECFATGTNTVGTESWDAVAWQSLAALSDEDETVYTNNYKQVSDNAYAAAANTNGNFLKSVDWDEDGTLDIVLHEDWNMTMTLNTTKKGVINTIDEVGMTTKNTIGEITPYTVINYMLADGTFYAVNADVLSGLTLASGNDAVNFKNGYVTLSDGNQYKQSDVAVGVLANMYETDIMDCDADPKALVNYTWYLDCGGYIRIYGADATVYDGLYLLTEATSVKSGRDSYTKNVDTYKQSNDMVNYTAIDIFNTFVPNLPNNAYGEALNGAVALEAETNLAAGIAADTALTVANATVLFNTDAVIELQGKVNDYTYTTTDDYGKYGEYNVNNGGAEAEIVYTTTTTDYYYVTLALDRELNTYVKSVQYFQGYNNMPKYDFGGREIAYAAAAVETDVNGNEYYLANTVVIETFENTVNVQAPYFAYEHVSGSKDAKTGIYNAVAPTGENTNYTVTGLQADYIDDVYGALGFYSFDVNTGVATQIVDNWATYGISAHTVAIEETGLVDYYVLDNVGGTRIKVTAETPVYAVMNETNNANIPYKYWTVTDWSENLAEGDQIVIVKNTITQAIQYILVFKGTDDLGWFQTWAYDANGTAKQLFDAVKAGTGIYGVDAVKTAFENAVKAYAADKTDANYDAMLLAWDAFVEATDGNTTSDYKQDLFTYYTAVTTADFNAFKALVTEAGNLYVDPYRADAIEKAYAKLSDAEKDHLKTYQPNDYKIIEAYVEVANTAVKAADDMVKASAAVTASKTVAEKEIAVQALVNAYVDFMATGLMAEDGKEVDQAIEALATLYTNDELTTKQKVAVVTADAKAALATESEDVVVVAGFAPNTWTITMVDDNGNFFVDSGLAALINAYSATVEVSWIDVTGWTPVTGTLLTDSLDAWHDAFVAGEMDADLGVRATVNGVTYTFILTI